MSEKTDTVYRFFNKKLFFEIFRQLSVISLIFLAIIMIFTIFIPVENAFMLSINAAVMSLGISKQYVTMDAFYIFILTYVIAAPVITLRAFRFMTKRNSSDYYYSFPYTRTCMYVTIVSAVISWIFIILACNMTVAVITYNILGEFFILSITELIMFTAAMFLCSLLVTASITIACSVTGTIFTNLSVSGLIIFLPRTIISILCAILTGSQHMFVFNKISPILSTDINLVFDTVAEFPSRFIPSYRNTTSVVYTLMLTTAYFITAWILFVKRKSETAGNPAGGKKTQCLFRISVGLPVTLIAISMFFPLITGDNVLPLPVFAFNIITIYLSAAILMFVYELISSRKLKNTIRVIPSTGILLAINVITIAGLYGIYVKELNYCPDGSEIEYVTIADKRYGEADYFIQQLNKYKITDKKVIEFAAGKLSENVRQVKKHSIHKYLMRDDCISLALGIRSGFSTKYRNLAMTYKEYADFCNILFETDEIRNLYVSLPEYDKYSAYVLNDYTENTDETSSEKLYNTLRDELLTVDPSYWAVSLNYDYTAPLSMTIITVLDGKPVNTTIPLNDAVPKTLQTYLETVNSNLDKKRAEKVFETIDSYNPDTDEDDIEYSITLSRFSKDYSAYDYTYEIDNYSQDLVTVYNSGNENNNMYMIPESVYDDEEDIDDELEVSLSESSYNNLVNYIRECFSSADKDYIIPKDGCFLYRIEIEKFDYSEEYDDYDEDYDDYDEDYDEDYDDYGDGEDEDESDDYISESLYIWLSPDAITKSAPELKNYK